MFLGRMNKTNPQMLSKETTSQLHSVTACLDSKGQCHLMEPSFRRSGPWANV